MSTTKTQALDEYEAKRQALDAVAHLAASNGKAWREAWKTYELAARAYAEFLR